VTRPTQEQMDWEKRDDRKYNGCEAVLISPRSVCRVCVQLTICVSHFGVDDVFNPLICVHVLATAVLHRVSTVAWLCRHCDRLAFVCMWETTVDSAVDVRWFPRVPRRVPPSLIFREWNIVFCVSYVFIFKFHLVADRMTVYAINCILWLFV